MLDPIQAAALHRARISGVRVSGIAGSGKSTLAAAIASDAALRGLNCLLFNAPESMARPVPVPGRPIRLPSTLKARFIDAPIAAGPSATETDPAQQDPVALRAALDPDGAALALRLLEQARQIAAQHDLTAHDVEALARPLAIDGEALARLELALEDARTFADAIYGGNERPGATLSMVRDLVCGPLPADPTAVLLLASFDGPLEAHLAKLAAGMEGTIRTQEELRRLAGIVVDLPDQTGTILDAQSWVKQLVRALNAAITLLQDYPDPATALAVCDTRSVEARVIRSCVDKRHDNAAAIKACRKLGTRHEDQATALQPFLAEHGGRTCADVLRVLEGDPVREAAQADLGIVAQRLRAGRHAATRLREAIPLLKDTLPAGVLASLANVPLDDAGVPCLSGPTPDKLRAADILRGLRAEFTKLGYGDVLAPPDNFEGRIRGARRPSGLSSGSSRPVPPQVLDLLLPEAGSLAETPTSEDWKRFVMHVAPSAPEATPPDLHALATLSFDVVIVDDAHLLSDEILGILRRCGPIVHEIAVPVSAETLHLARSHRQLTSGLLALVPDGAPTYLGGPAKGGLLVRGWTAADKIEVRHAVRYLKLAAEKAGRSVAVIDAAHADDAPGEHDVIIVHGSAKSAVAAARKVAAYARLAVVACGQGLASSQPSIPRPGPGDDALEALGWKLVDSTFDGRVYSKDNEMAVLANEPHWLDRSDEDLLSRISRLRALGWKPVISWTGSERPSADLAGLLARNAVPAGPDVLALLSGDLPKRPELDSGSIASKVPFPEAAMNPDDEIRWRLRYLRDKLLMPETPYVDPARCILRDEMIEAFVAANITELTHFKRLPEKLREATDGCQMPILRTVIEIKERLPPASLPDILPEITPAFMIPPTSPDGIRPSR